MLATYNLIIIRPDATALPGGSFESGFTPSYWEKEKNKQMKNNDVLTYRSRYVKGKAVVTAVSIFCNDGYVEVLLLDKNSIK